MKTLLTSLALLAVVWTAAAFVAFRLEHPALTDVEALLQWRAVLFPPRVTPLHQAIAAALCILLGGAWLRGATRARAVRVPTSAKLRPYRDALRRGCIYLDEIAAFALCMLIAVVLLACLSDLDLAAAGR